MSNIFRRKQKTINNLPKGRIDVTSLYAKTKILVVDDEDFDKEKGLRSAGFNIVKKDKWERIEDAEPYHIIVSDIRGVADRFQDKSEGAFVLQMIHERYPDKCCIVYTNSVMNPRDNKFLNGIRLLEKTDDISEWKEALAESIEEVYNPQAIWKKFEEYMEKHDVPRELQRKLEDEYVSSLLEGEQSHKKWSTRGFEISGDVLQILSACFNLASIAIEIMRR